MFRKLILAGLAAVGIGMAVPIVASAQFITPYSGYNPYTNRFYQGTYTASPFGGVVQNERMYNPYTGTTTFGQQTFNPYSGFGTTNVYRYNPYSNQYQYRTWNSYRGPLGYPY